MSKEANRQVKRGSWYTTYLNLVLTSFEAAVDSFLDIRWRCLLREREREREQDFFLDELDCKSDDCEESFCSCPLVIVILCCWESKGDKKIWWVSCISLSSRNPALKVVIGMSTTWFSDSLLRGWSESEVGICRCMSLWPGFNGCVSSQVCILHSAHSKGGYITRLHARRSIHQKDTQNAHYFWLMWRVHRGCTSRTSVSQNALRAARFLSFWQNVGHLNVRIQMLLTVIIIFIPQSLYWL